MKNNNGPAVARESGFMRRWPARWLFLVELGGAALAGFAAAVLAVFLTHG